MDRMARFLTLTSEGTEAMCDQARRWRWASEDDVGSALSADMRFERA